MDKLRTQPRPAPRSSFVKRSWPWERRHAERRRLFDTHRAVLLARLHDLGLAYEIVERERQQHGVRPDFAALHVQRGCAVRLTYSTDTRLHACWEVELGTVRAVGHVGEFKASDPVQVVVLFTSIVARWREQAQLGRLPWIGRCGWQFCEVDTLTVWDAYPTTDQRQRAELRRRHARRQA